MTLRLTRFLVMASLLAWITAAEAVCLDPKSGVSGYKIPLKEEIASSEIIVTAEVTNSRELQEDPADPTGITAYIYTAHVLQQLKGRLPKTFKLRTENDSGRYPMEVGEKHVLFLHHEGKFLEADSCGSSSPLPEGDAVLHRVEEVLKANNAR